MVICSEKFGNLIVKDLKKNQDSVMDVNLTDIENARYCVTARVYRVVMNLDELLKFAKNNVYFLIIFEVVDLRSNHAHSSSSFFRHNGHSEQFHVEQSSLNLRISCSFTIISFKGSGLFFGIFFFTSLITILLLDS